MVVVLRIDLHCDACSEEIKRRILKIKGVEEAVPHIKSSQLMVKGMVEPATLVGFIHKCTGRKAAIIRAEPLDPLPPSMSPPPPMDAPLMEAETPADAGTKQQDPSDNQEEKKEGKEEKNEGVQEDNRGREEEDNVDEKLKMEKPNEGNGIENEETHVDVPNNGVVEENHTKDHLFKVPVPAAVVEVAPESEKMAMNSYQCPAYPYAYQYQYQYPQLYSYAGNPAMYAYPHYSPQTFSDENPNACTIM